MKPLKLEEYKKTKEFKDWLINIEFCFDEVSKYAQLNSYMTKEEWLDDMVYNKYEEYLEGFKDE